MTHKIPLKPFTLKECRDYFQARGFRLGEKQIAECYMVLGGVPFYLSKMEKGEGVDRMYRELEEAGNPAPEFKQQDFMVLATIRQHKNAVVQGVSEDTSKGTSRGQVRGQVVHLLETLKDDEMSVRELMDKLDFKSRDKFLANYLTPALEAGYVEMTQPDSPKSPTQKYRLSEAGRKVMDGAK